MFQHCCAIFREFLHKVLKINLSNKNMKMIPSMEKRKSENI
jgi:hypothetical protein